MAGQIQSFRDLIAWQKAIELCKGVYAASATFPDAERFGLTSQIRRAAVSVPSNIAEGYGRRRTKDYIRYLDMARASLYEVDTQLVLAKELGFAEKNELDPLMMLLNEAGRVLSGLIASIERTDESNRR